MEATVREIDLDALQIAFQTLYRAADEMFRSEAPKILFDILLVKLVHGAPYQALGKVMSGGGSLQPTTTAKSAKTLTPASRPLSQATSTPEAGFSEELLTRALKKRPQDRAYLDEAISRFWEGSTFIVIFER